MTKQELQKITEWIAIHRGNMQNSENFWKQMFNLMRSMVKDIDIIDEIKTNLICQ